MSTNINTSTRRQIIRECRKQKRVSQFRSAVDLNISESQFRNIEAGRSNPRANLMFRMAHYFDKTPEELFPDLVQEASEKTS